MGANWSLWADIPHTELWRAVALSLDIEPSRLPGYDDSAARDLFHNFPFVRCSDEFKQRLEIARNHLGSRLVALSRYETYWEAPVELVTLREWGESLANPWLFPEQFPKIMAVADAATKLSESSDATSRSKATHVQSLDPLVPSSAPIAETEHSGKDWITKAILYAKQYVEKQAAIGAYPSQQNIGDHVAKRFREEGIKTKTGKVATGSYIKRYALKGIRSR